MMGFDVPKRRGSGHEIFIIIVFALLFGLVFDVAENACVAVRVGPLNQNKWKKPGTLLFLSGRCCCSQASAYY